MSGAADPAALGGPPDWFDRLARLLPRLADWPLASRLTPPPQVTPRQSAVLILFSAGQRPSGPDVLLTQRASTLRSHAGQVAFPGGQIDPGDVDPAAAALREASEETGLDPAGVSIAGTGPALYVPPSGFLVHPVLAWWRRPVPVRVMDPAEVELVARTPVAELVDPANRFSVRHPSGMIGPGFAVRGLFVWGFTALVLSRTLQLAGLERAWDPNRSRPMPIPVSLPVRVPDSGPSSIAAAIPESAAGSAPGSTAEAASQ